MSDHPLPAGEFSAWVEQMHAAMRGEQVADVPCGGCAACCRSSQFVHIGPDEADTLAHVPAALLVPAPGLPHGHVVLGYDEHGCCPMLVDDRCSIYAHRPRTCRTYDCRVFPAADVEPDDRPLIAERAGRWKFEYADDASRDRHAAVGAAAAYIRSHDGLDLGASDNATRLAVAAVQVQGLFHGSSPAPEDVRVELRRWARRD